MCPSTMNGVELAGATTTRRHAPAGHACVLAAAVTLGCLKHRRVLGHGGAGQWLLLLLCGSGGWHGTGVTTAVAVAASARPAAAAAAATATVATATTGTAPATATAIDTTVAGVGRVVFGAAGEVGGKVSGV